MFIPLCLHSWKRAKLVFFLVAPICWQLQWLTAFSFHFWCSAWSTTTPSLRPLLADTWARGSLKRQFLGTADSGPGEDHEDLGTLWVAQFSWNTWTQFSPHPPAPLSKNIDDFSQKFEPRYFNVIWKLRIKDVFYLKEQQYNNPAIQQKVVSYVQDREVVPSQPCGDACCTPFPVTVLKL